ncbi:hypothetical protein MtrunA17_Chr1g0205111 [Medicago truncatula]|uniref:Uncharacterized protein n=1 Tax=Medicago truncatula TaxID=3880 RepID=A0A072VPW5_MEDTR|nr:hypothetical protein MTR_1g103310 [Medicago truncatula]RHN81993.1 hypothetical protein MtrunA17_Chr1g0205111 [Medicago truncatula]
MAQFSIVFVTIPYLYEFIWKIQWTPLSSLLSQKSFPKTHIQRRINVIKFLLKAKAKAKHSYHLCFFHQRSIDRLLDVGCVCVKQHLVTTSIFNRNDYYNLINLHI